MCGLEIGSHVSAVDPVGEAIGRDARVAQIMLGDPQKWTTPTVAYPGGAQALREAAEDAGVALVVHSAYLINVASTNNRVRIPSRQLVQKTLNLAAEIGAIGVVVHGGHVAADENPAAGFENWFKAVNGWEFPVPLLIENTAGGTRAMARTLQSWQSLWTAIAPADSSENVGVCLDTCHAHAAGLDLATVVDDLMAITGRIDLVHANDSRDAAGSGADRHANLGQGQIDPAALVAVVAQASAPTVVETPGSAAAQTADIAWLRQRLEEASK